MVRGERRGHGGHRPGDRRGIHAAGGGRGPPAPRPGPTRSARSARSAPAGTRPPGARGGPRTRARPASLPRRCPLGPSALLLPGAGRGGPGGPRFQETQDEVAERAASARRGDHVLVPLVPDVGEHVPLRVVQAQDALLDALLRDQQQLLHRALRSDPVDARDPLLEPGRVPRQVQVDDHVRRLEVQPHAARVGAHEHGGALRSVKARISAGRAYRHVAPQVEHGEPQPAHSASTRSVMSVHSENTTALRPSPRQRSRSASSSSASLGTPVFDLLPQHVRAVAAPPRDHQQALHALEVRGQDHLLAGDPRDGRMTSS